MAVVETCLSVEDLLMLSDRVLFVDADMNSGAWIGAFDNGHRFLTGPTQVGVAMGFADFAYRTEGLGVYEIVKARKPIRAFVYDWRAWIVAPDLAVAA